MARAKDLLVSLGLLAAGRRRPKLPRDREPIVPPGDRRPGSELAVVLLLLLTALFSAAFIAFYALDRLPNQTQLMGGALGLAFLSLAAALILLGKRLVVTEEIEEDYPAIEHETEQESIVQVVSDSGSRISRRRLLTVSFGVAGTALGAALITPAASLGPFLDVDLFYATTWKRGRRLVDEHDKPYHADDIDFATFYTAFPEGADKEAISSPVVVIRLAPKEFHLPPSLEHYPAQGIVAFSKICTHAGCAISLYRTPLFRPDEFRPALVCPCHYSTFDPTTGGEVLFGPAGRRLPMLPLLVDPNGFLRAAGTYDDPVGPSWWGVRMEKPRPA
jgi:ubiquinol-cytochrome c reductase iron-sulfur subunit